MQFISTYSEDDYSYFDPRICVIGLGHVGLLHAISFSEQFRTMAYDPQLNRTEELSRGKDRTLQVPEELLRNAIHRGLTFTSDLSVVQKSNFYVITLCKQQQAEGVNSHLPLCSACEFVGKVISGGDIVVFDSCGIPAMSEDQCIPLIEKISGLTCNFDFFVGYSPGEHLFGDKGFTFWNDGKPRSGSTPEIAKIVDEVYYKAFAREYLKPHVQQSRLSGVI